MTSQFKSKRAVAKLSPLASIFHPHWSSRDDHALMKAKASGDNFTQIAGRLGRQRVAVEQRWQRLRVIPGIVKKLEAHGLTSKPYSINGGPHG
ncbi:hypothetical protein [Aliiroseovarius lamellibrachiae]|uniref:hypothetical protein n=1 Tax=Aliiroseovarius lamellibrachiae TaxID=1924933 RepID=UPI001BE04746|nr:hypothetical protein [Aliiroseovarius lamellibrachiae]MBT2130103.1 hypothetical protein [Aliiroseovarius lamellibrachiae]